MNGILIVNKPRDWTSFDVVAKIRGLTKVKRVGHSGTLDPMATGVLPVFLGEATKLVQHFLNGDKGYTGEMVLGVRTDTGDAMGKSQIPNPKFQINPNDQIPMTKIEEVFKRFTGEIEQVPPMYSAVKINGQRLYELARKGVEVERKPRKVTIYKLEYRQPVTVTLPTDDTGFVTEKRIPFYVECSKGTYIRQLAVDIGDDLGCGAHLSRLERVYAHPFHISQALGMEAIIDLAKVGRLETVIISAEEILSGQRAS